MRGMKRTCLNQNCAPVCPHIIVTPTLEQHRKLCHAVNDWHGYGKLTDEERDDLIQMLKRQGPYRLEEK